MKRPQHRPRTGPTKPGELLGEAEIRALIDAASAKAPTGVRNRALIALLYGSGLKLSQALALEATDVEPDALRVRGPANAGQQGERCVRLFPSAVPYVETWRLVRARSLTGDCPWFFCTLRGGPLSDAYVRALFARLARRAGLDRRVHAEGLRQAFAMNVFQQGGDVEALREQLGHAQAETTWGLLAKHAVQAPGAALRTLDVTLQPEERVLRTEIVWREGPAPRSPLQAAPQAAPPPALPAVPTAPQAQPPDADPDKVTVRRVELPEIGAASPRTPPSDKGGG